jgi:hypothetical protein
MVKAWDARCRRWYHDRYDARVNLVSVSHEQGPAGRSHPPAAAARSCHHPSINACLHITVPATRAAPALALTCPAITAVTRQPACCFLQVDWDYQMRLAQQGSRPAEAPLGHLGHLGHIIHWQHFREWRLHGVAHELRDCVYNQPNRSLLSTAVGRTKEFKDRWETLAAWARAGPGHRWGLQLGFREAASWCCHQCW